MGELFSFFVEYSVYYLRFLFTYWYYNYYPCKNEAASLVVYI